MKIFLVLLMSVLTFSGCAKLEHLDELLTLKDMSEEDDAQRAYVKAQDIKFEALVSEVQAGTLKKGLSQKEAVKSFGDPIVKRAIVRNGQDVEWWVRRYAMRFWDSDKVYLYFDKDKKLTDWEFVKYVKLKTDPLLSSKDKTKRQSDEQKQ